MFDCRTRHVTLAWFIVACTGVPCVRSTGRWRTVSRRTLWCQWPLYTLPQFKRWNPRMRTRLLHQTHLLTTTGIPIWKCRLCRIMYPIPYISTRSFVMFRRVPHGCKNYKYFGPHTQSTFYFIPVPSRDKEVTWLLGPPVPARFFMILDLKFLSDVDKYIFFFGIFIFISL